MDPLTIHLYRARLVHGKPFAFYQNDHAEAESFFRDALALSRELEDQLGVSHALSNLGCIAIEQARYADAERLFNESLAILRRLDDKRNQARTLSTLGVVARARGELARARVVFEESLSLARDVGDRYSISALLYSLGHVECEQGNYSLAEAWLRESATMSQDLDDRDGIAQGLECLARVAVATDSPERGARMWGAAERMREEIGHPMLLNHRPSYNRAVVAARAALGDDAFDRAWNDGRAMPLEDAVKYALSGDDTPPRH